MPIKNTICNKSVNFFNKLALKKSHCKIYLRVPCHKFSVCYCHCLLSKSVFCLFREWMKLCLLGPYICLFARVWVKTGSWHVQSFYSNCTKNKSTIFVRRKKNTLRNSIFFPAQTFFFQDTLQKFWWLSTRITAKMDCF